MTFEEWSNQFDAIWKMIQKGNNMLHYSGMLVEHCGKYEKEWNYRG